MRPLFVFIVCVACSCSGGARRSASLTDPATADPAIAIRGVLDSTYAALAAGDAEKLEAHFVLDPAALLMGIDDAFFDHASFREHMKRPIFATPNIRLQHGDVRIGVAPGARSAWVADRPKLIASDDANPNELRMTALLENLDGRWKISAFLLSAAYPDEEALPRAIEGKFDGPSVFTERIPKNAEAAVVAFRAAFESFPDRVDSLWSSRSDGFVFGTDPKEAADLATWHQMIKALPQLHQAMEYVVAPVGPLRAGGTADGKTGRREVVCEVVGEFAIA